VSGPAVLGEDGLFSNPGLTGCRTARSWTVLQTPVVACQGPITAPLHSTWPPLIGRKLSTVDLLIVPQPHSAVHGREP
jgi:hypothetical protein